MAENVMGYQAKLYYGTAGSTAATQITKARDIQYAFSHDMGETTSRGDGSAIPIECKAPVLKKLDSLTWSMVDSASDTALTALRAAADAATCVSLKLIDRASGYGFDGDVYLKCALGAPLKGETTYDFEVIGVSNGQGRNPSFNTT